MPLFASLLALAKRGEDEPQKALVPTHRTCAECDASVPIEAARKHALGHWGDNGRFPGGTHQLTGEALRRAETLCGEAIY